MGLIEKLSYDKTNWNNDAPPSLDANNLNNIEDGVKNASSTINNIIDNLDAYLGNINIELLPEVQDIQNITVEEFDNIWGKCFITPSKDIYYLIRTNEAYSTLYYYTLADDSFIDIWKIQKENGNITIDILYEESIDDITKVEANPVLSGTEAGLTGLEIERTKYAINGFTGKISVTVVGGQNVIAGNTLATSGLYILREGSSNVGYLCVLAAGTATVIGMYHGNIIQATNVSPSGNFVLTDHIYSGGTKLYKHTLNLKNYPSYSKTIIDSNGVTTTTGTYSYAGKTITVVTNSSDSMSSLIDNSVTYSQIQEVIMETNNHYACVGSLRQFSSPQISFIETSNSSIEYTTLIFDNTEVIEDIITPL